MKLYQQIAIHFSAMLNCEKHNNLEWFAVHRATIESLIKEHMPSGSGFDNGTNLAFEKSNSEKLVLNTSFHHMDENGFYDGWTEHQIVVTASLAFSFNIKVTGENRNDIKEYIADCFHTSLNEIVK